MCVCEEVSLNVEATCVFVQLIPTDDDDDDDIHRACAESAVNLLHGVETNHIFWFVGVDLTMQHLKTEILWVLLMKLIPHMLKPWRDVSSYMIGLFIYYWTTDTDTFGIISK